MKMRFSNGEYKSEIKEKKPVTILAYLKENKLGKDFKIPALLIAPIVIVPKGYETNKTGEELSDEIFKRIIPIRLVFNNTKSNDDNDIEVNFRQALNRGNLKGEASELNLNKSVTEENKTMNVTTGTNTTIETTTPQVTTILEVTQNVMKPTSTEASGTYPTAIYNNQQVETLTITDMKDRPPDYFLLPPLLNEEWKNFTVTTNFNITKENATESTENADNTTTSQSVNETDSTIKGPYSAALYHNGEIDQVSITTNSYTNESPLPPPQDDRWRSFSLNQMFSTSNEFRPLAGLYYDGFLHRPLPTKPGFVPYNQYFRYN
ncbi:hypothetical protein HW555_004475 [Spodoptera exigua]|uniref:Uncharacterized protein n=1 Tax=Spodoptera exigua TaxID=7107 RepID=A0A835GLY3_SPOEX|nr:hypothetical protein HW555_004475 [Spodoptera exigua]